MTFQHPGVRHVTPLTKGRRNYGAAVARIARAFGTPLMPWQQHAAALQTERLDDGRWAYDELLFTVQRRAGKTTVRVPITWHRALIRPGCRLWLTAQTRQDARDIMVDDVGALVRKAPRVLASRAKLRRSQGSEGWHFTNGSIWRVFAPGEDAMHGKASELVDVDEGWAFDALQGSAVEQAVAPTKLTTDGQFSVFSTMGTASSSWFHHKIAKGRQAAADGSREGVAIIDMGIPYELAGQVRAQLEQGPGSPDWATAMGTLARHHPAFGYTITRVGAFDSVARQLFDAADGGGVDGVLRALGNVETATTTAAIPAVSWARLKRDTWPEPSRPLVFALEVGMDRADACIAAAWIDDTGAVLVDVLEHGPGADWIPGRLAELKTRWKPARVVADRVGPVVDLVDELRRLGHVIDCPTSSEYATACQGLLDAVLDEARLGHPGHRALDAAVKAAVTAPLGDGWKWSRRKSADSIAALVAVTLARWGLLTMPAPMPAPFVR